MNSFYQDLKSRNLIYQFSDLQLESFLEKPTTVYLGFDPTAESLHVGNLLGLVMLRRFYEAGHTVIALIGGATGLIGDPSGKKQERSLLSDEQIKKNVAGILQVIQRFLDVSSKRVHILNNLAWLGSLSCLSLLREVGKHFTINWMLDKDAVHSRLQTRSDGLSYTEFSYLLLQAYDFYHLHHHYQCQGQLGGADQWGNMTAGIELIRRKKVLLEDQQGASVWCLTWPLLMKTDGTKFGKSETGNLWLSAEKTKPYDFYQYFLRVSDQEVIDLLKKLTFLNLQQIQDLEKCVQSQPEKREAQAMLAQELTLLVHGQEECIQAQRASQSLFAENFQTMSAQEFDLWLSRLPASQQSQMQWQEGLSLVDLLVVSQLSSSKTQARQEIQSGGIYLNHQRIQSIPFLMKREHLLWERFVVLRKGKKNYHVVCFHAASLDGVS